jgi:hypothetical protein
MFEVEKRPVCATMEKMSAPTGCGVSPVASVDDPSYIAIIEPADVELDATACRTWDKPYALSPPVTLIVAPGQSRRYTAAAACAIGRKAVEPMRLSEPVGHGVDLPDDDAGVMVLLLLPEVHPASDVTTMRAQDATT